MSDIVERLREIEWPLTQEAAAEIERLRRDSDELDRLTIQWNAARAERLEAIAEVERWRSLWDDQMREKNVLKLEVIQLKADRDEAWTKHVIEREDLKAEIARLHAEHLINPIK